MSSFSLSKILPIIVPAAAVAIGCWWYYSRKKKPNQSKPETAPHPVALVSLNAFVPPEDNVSSTGAWSVHCGSSLRHSSSQSDSSGNLDILPVIASDLHGSSGDVLESESKVQNGEICLLQQRTKCEDLHTSLTRHVLECHREPQADTCLEHEDFVLDELHLEDSPRHPVQTESPNIPEVQISKIEYQQIKADPDHFQETLSQKPEYVGSDVIERDAYKDEPSIDDVMKKMVSIQESQIDESVKVLPMMENPSSAMEWRELCVDVLPEGNETLSATECIPKESDTASMGAENMEKDGFPNRCKVSSCPEFQICHSCTDDSSNKRFFGDYEAKMVEELAINIISKVIVAAKQELLASAVRDLSDGDYLESDECMSEKSMPLVQNTTSSHEESDSFSTRDSTSESTQTEQNQVDDLRDLDGKGQVCQEANQEGCDCGEQKEPDLSPVHVCTDSFDEVHVAIDDSSMSACTSEDGVCLEDPLQSTVLSSIGIGSYDSLSTSGIELSRDQISVRKKKVKKDKAARKNYLLANGHSNSSSLDLKEGASISETEIDHTGDMNGMDSADGVSTLGSTEQLQNKASSKNLPIVVWEFEVPKHLVGRLIGKQGRFVTYLKETSGAKIYITTLPFTQEFQLCHIEGSQEAVDIALDLISKKFRDLDLTNFYQPPLLQRQGSLPTTSWLVLPEGVTIEVVVSSIASATHLFIQQHTHPTYHALSTLDQQMYFCYMEPGIPTLPTPVEVGTICAAPNENNEWWRAQVVSYFPNTEEVFIRYVDYGGYKRVKIKTLRQIRSDFVTLPFQGTEVLLDNVTPIHGDNTFNAEAIEAVGEMLNGVPLYAQVTNYDLATKIQMIQLWAMVGGEAVSINTLIVERGYARWQDAY